MYKCDRCGEGYSAPSAAVQGVSRIHLICPLCELDFRTWVDGFVDEPIADGTIRKTGHIITRVLDLHNKRDKS